MDVELFVIQVASLFLEPKDLLQSLIQRFSLERHLGMVSGDEQHSSDDSDGEDLIPVYGSCLEDFLLLLIALINNRNPFLPTRDEEGEIETEIIQTLFLGPCSHSKLDKHLPSRLTENPGFESVLKRVSDFKYPLRLEDQGTYTLKSSFIEKIQPYYHHYNPKDRSLVEEKLKQHGKSGGSKSNSSKSPLILPPVISHSPVFSSKNLDSIVCCERFMDLLSTCLSRTSCASSADTLETSIIYDNLIDIVLYLILMSSQEMEFHHIIPDNIQMILSVS